MSLLVALPLDALVQIPSTKQLQRRPRYFQTSPFKTPPANQMGIFLQSLWGRVCPTLLVSSTVKKGILACFVAFAVASLLRNPRHGGGYAEGSWVYIRRIQCKKAAYLYVYSVHARRIYKL